MPDANQRLLAFGGDYQLKPALGYTDDTKRYRVWIIYMSWTTSNKAANIAASR
ncbi:MAG: hypothetical protein H7240_12360 [Glaciimonas sp.]|nr:hypothetical protein [Glaciimonas sp.]